MKELSRIPTVGELKKHLAVLSDNTVVSVMFDDGTSFPLTGAIRITGEDPPELWLLTEDVDDWGPSDDEDEVDEQTLVESVQTTASKESEDVVQVRGKMRSA